MTAASSVCRFAGPTWASKRAAEAGCTNQAAAYWCQLHNGWHAALIRHIETNQHPTERPPA